VGVFRQIERPEYSSEMGRQLVAESERKGAGNLAALLRSNGTWVVD
jgi:hypothetical protein